VLVARCAHLTVWCRGLCDGGGDGCWGVGDVAAINGGADGVDSSMHGHILEACCALLHTCRVHTCATWPVHGDLQASHASCLKFSLHCCHQGSQLNGTMLQHLWHAAHVMWLGMMPSTLMSQVCRPRTKRLLVQTLQMNRRHSRSSNQMHK
jgi:hypothetical protein